jgi:hypothetical protein
LYFKFNQSRSDFLQDVQRLHQVTFLNLTSQKSTEVSGTYEKKGPSCFHQGLKHFRAAPWTKLLALWNVTKTLKNYSHVLFLDSDAVISPRYHNVSLAEKIEQWRGRGKSYDIKNELTKVRSSRSSSIDPAEAAMIFTDNVPFVPYDRYPCTGAFVLNFHFNVSHMRRRGVDFVADMLKEWWDAALEKRNFNHAYEQDSLWTLLYGNIMHGALKTELRASSRINAKTVSIVGEHQFPPFDPRLWVSHAGSPWQNERIGHFKSLLQELSINESLFEKTVEFIDAECSRHAKTTDIENLIFHAPSN